MTFALWLFCGIAVCVFLATWAIELAVWLLGVALRLTGLVAMILFGLASILALAFLDRKQLARIWRNERTQADNAALLARERWS